MGRVFSFIGGAIIGALVGSTIALLLTPSSGEDLRMQIQDRVVEIQTEVKQAAATRRAEMEQQLAMLRSGRRTASE